MDKATLGTVSIAILRTSGRRGFRQWMQVCAMALGILCSATTAQEVSAVMLETPILPEHVDPPIGSSVLDSPSQAGFSGCTSCGSIGCTGCAEFGPGFQSPPGLGLWVRADYLIWYEKESNVIPLVTTSTGPSTLPDLLTLSGAETSTLYGGNATDDNPVYGWRIELGTWLDATATCGIMGRYFGIGDRHNTFAAGPDDFNFLGIPFFDPDINAEDALALTIPNERRGLVNVDLHADVKNWEVLFRRLAQTGPNYRLDWIHGYRNFSLDETLRIEASTLTTDPSAGIVNTLVELNDQFDVENQFHGFDIGIMGHSHEGCWSLDFLMKVALGVMDQEVDVSGTQLTSIPGLDPSRNIGGLFSQESNIGQTDEATFAVIPEVNLNLGYALTPNVDFTVGYSFIYVSNILRAGAVVDRTVDPGLVVDLDPINSNRPQLNLDDTSYFLHGLNLGLTARY